jgi:hypothetical protein
MPLPESCHDEVIFDDKCDDFTVLGVDLEAFQEGNGQPGAALTVILDADSLADIMQEQDEVEQRRLVGFVQLRAVFQRDRLGLGENSVEFPDGAERMDVSGVPVIKLMLDEAGQAGELRNEPSQHAQFVHELEGGKDRARLLENALEADVGVG